MIYIKKIYKILISAVISVTALFAFCLTSFASPATIDFQQNFNVKYCIITASGYDMDGKLVTVPSSYFRSGWYDNNQRLFYDDPLDKLYTEVTYSKLDLRFSWTGQEIKANDNLKFKYTIGLYNEDAFYTDINSSLFIRYKSSGKWSTWKYLYAPTYTDNPNVVPPDLGSEGIFSINFDYTFPVDVEELEFSLNIFAPSGAPLFQYIQYYFPLFVTDYSLVNSNSAEYPKYQNPNETIGKDTNELKNQEDKLMQDTEQGRNETLSLFSSLGDLISEFAVPLLAIKGLFDYLVNGTLFQGILLISLALGLLSFVFNIFPSIQARQNRERQAEAQRTKNAQYNAMMNKLNKGGG